MLRQAALVTAILASSLALATCRTPSTGVAFTSTPQTPWAVDPTACKPKAGTSDPQSVPSDLHDLTPIGGTSISLTDFDFEFWLFCDDALSPDRPDAYSTIAGLGVYGSWTYRGPRQEGPVHDFWGFEPEVTMGSGSSGPLFRASSHGTFGILTPEPDILRHIENGSPLQFEIAVETPAGRTGAVFAFHLAPGPAGYVPSLPVAETQPSTE